MSGRGRRVDVRIAHTATFLLRCPRSSVPEAMRACKYTFDESASRSKQMAIRRSFAKATGGELVAPLDVIVAAATATMTTVSPLTNQTSAVRGPSTPMTTTTTTTRMPFKGENKKYYATIKWLSNGFQPPLPHPHVATMATA
jgi:hypothetical protein